MSTEPESDSSLDPVLDAVEALPGLCRIVKRSGALDGSLPMRAVQYLSRSPSRPAVLGLLLQVTLDVTHAELDVVVGVLITGVQEGRAAARQ
jgi:hypothetical protein